MPLKYKPGRYAFLSVAALAMIAVGRICSADDLRPGDHLPLPDIGWQDAEGNSHLLHDSHGKPRVLHFWASWCIPCRKEMPELLQWQSENNDILLIPLSLDKRLATARNFITTNHLDIPPLLIDDADSRTLGIPVLPYTLFVTADGLFAGQISGAAPWLEPGFNAKVLHMFKP